MALPDCGPLGAATGRYEPLRAFSAAIVTVPWSDRANKNGPGLPLTGYLSRGMLLTVPGVRHLEPTPEDANNIAPATLFLLAVSLPQPAGRRQIPRISATC